MVDRGASNKKTLSKLIEKFKTALKTRNVIIFPEGTTEETKKDLPYIFVGIYEMLGQNKNEEILDFAKKMEECFKPLVSENQQPKATTTETTSTSEKGSRFFKNLR